MMKHFMMTLIALFCIINVKAQKITRNYDNIFLQGHSHCKSCLRYTSRYMLGT